MAENDYPAEIIDLPYPDDPELAELAFDEYTPASAWAVWELLMDGLYFTGEPAAIQVRSADEVAAEEAARAAKAAEAQAWADFTMRGANHTYLPEDER